VEGVTFAGGVLPLAGEVVVVRRSAIWLPLLIGSRAGLS
jgi:hypothetical protein